MKKTTLLSLVLLISTCMAFAQWQKLNLTKTAGGVIPGKINQMTIFENKLYAATTDGIWYSESMNGGDWKPYGLQGKEVSHINFKNLILAVALETATDDATKTTGKLYKLVNSSWTVTNYNPTTLTGFDVTIDFAQIKKDTKDIIIVPNWGRGIWRSEDGGNTWTNYPQEPFADDNTKFHYKNVTGAYVVPNDNVIYTTDKVTGTIQYLNYSNDYGVTWNKVVVSNFFNPYAFHKRTVGGKSYIYWGGENGNIGAIWRSEDNGLNWDASFTMGVPYWQNRRIVGNNDGPLYIMCSVDNIYVSNDNGDTFSPVSTSKIPVPSTRPSANLYYTHMALSNDKLYVSTVLDGIYVTSVVTSITKNYKSSIVCYPNPTQNELMVNTQSGSKISIWTTTGKLIQTIETTSTKAIVNVKNLPPALYVVDVKSLDGKQYYGRFVKN